MKDTIGYAYVVADIFHVGHLQHLLNCKSLCDKLVVGVLTDKATMEKKQRPIISFDERIKIIGALACVDVVAAQDTYSPLSNITSMKPDIFFESVSHDSKDIDKHVHFMNSIGGRTIVMPYYVGQSSGEIKDKIVKEWKGGGKK